MAEATDVQTRSPEMDPLGSHGQQPGPRVPYHLPVLKNSLQPSAVSSRPGKASFLLPRLLGDGGLTLSVPPPAAALRPRPPAAPNLRAGQEQDRESGWERPPSPESVSREMAILRPSKARVTQRPSQQVPVVLWPTSEHGMGGPSDAAPGEATTLAFFGTAGLRDGDAGEGWAPAARGQLQPSAWAASGVDATTERAPWGRERKEAVPSAPALPAAPSSPFWLGTGPHWPHKSSHGTHTHTHTHTWCSSGSLTSAYARPPHSSSLGCGLFGSQHPSPLESPQPAPQPAQQGPFWEARWTQVSWARSLK